jgi:hypothetical protein
MHATFANSFRFCRSFSALVSAHATQLKVACFQQTVQNWSYPFYLLHIQKWGAISLPQMRAYGPFFGPSLACPSVSTLMKFQPLCSHGITHSGARGLPAGILEGDIVTSHQNPAFSFLASFLATRHWAKKTLWPPVPSKGVGTGQVWTYNLVRLRAMVPRKVSP